MNDPKVFKLEIVKPNRWRWYVFGDNSIVVTRPTRLPAWKRFIAWIILGSRWESSNEG